MNYYLIYSVPNINMNWNTTDHLDTHSKGKKKYNLYFSWKFIHTFLRRVNIWVCSGGPLYQLYTQIMLESILYCVIQNKMKENKLILFWRYKQNFRKLLLMFLFFVTFVCHCLWFPCVWYYLSREWIKVFIAQWSK